jgi:hypothetical protein
MSLYTAPACQSQQQGQEPRPQNHQVEWSYLPLLINPTPPFIDRQRNACDVNAILSFSDRPLFHGVESTRIESKGRTSYSTYHSSATSDPPARSVQLTTSPSISIALSTMDTSDARSQILSYFGPYATISPTFLPGYNTVTVRTGPDTDVCQIWPCGHGVMGISMRLDPHSFTSEHPPTQRPASVSRQSGRSNYSQCSRFRQVWLTSLWRCADV